MFFQLRMPKRTSKATTLLNRIVDLYLNSPDLNGIRANVVLADSGLQSLEALNKLVARGLVEVYSTDSVKVAVVAVINAGTSVGFFAMRYTH